MEQANVTIDHSLHERLVHLTGELKGSGALQRGSLPRGASWKKHKAWESLWWLLDQWLGYDVERWPSWSTIREGVQSKGRGQDVQMRYPAYMREHFKKIIAKVPGANKRWVVEHVVNLWSLHVQGTEAKLLEVAVERLYPGQPKEFMLGDASVRAEPIGWTPQDEAMLLDSAIDYVEEDDV